MDKKLLIPVDESVHAKNALKYVAAMARPIRRLFCVLAHVQPAISQFMIDEAQTSLEARAAVETLRKKCAAASNRILEERKEELVRLGMAEDRIETKSIPRRLGLAKDVLETAVNGLYDAVVVGRRGIGRISGLFTESLSANMVEHSLDVPVWVVDGEVKNAHRAMVAVDGSEASLAAVDHAAFMLGDDPVVTVDLFHATPSASGSCAIDFTETDADLEKIVVSGQLRCVDRFFGVALKRFAESGITEDRIRVHRTQQTRNAAKAIFDHAKQNGFGTIVMGRRGMSRSFFMGSVSRFILDKADGMAVWIVS